MRASTITRITTETSISLSLDLDGTGKADIATGVGFLDHMLRHIAVHGLFDLDVKATGDLEIDPHHTVEDVGIVLGQAFDQALGDHQGIVRMGSAYTPMDEALAFVAVDLSGRPYAAHGIDSALSGIVRLQREDQFACACRVWP
jgi:imidazoleglycerol-phosphate dehydratase